MVQIILKKPPGKKLAFRDIPSFTRSCNHDVTMEWEYFTKWVKNEKEECSLELDPWFQRGYVWTKAQQIAYIEYILRGGVSGRDIYFNNPVFHQGYTNPGPLGYVCVDGLQRITAVQGFINNQVPIFGDNYFRDFDGYLRGVRASFNVNINDLKTEKELLTWYYEMNSGGTVHTEEDLARVKERLIELEGSNA
jgi:hypothetical protein